MSGRYDIYQFQAFDTESSFATAVCRNKLAYVRERVNDYEKTVDPKDLDALIGKSVLNEVTYVRWRRPLPDG